jgi:hypothetical protein
MQQQQPPWGQFVSLDRYNAEHAAMLERLIILENRAESLRGAEEQHSALSNRISLLEHQDTTDEASERTRTDRIWVILIGIVTGVACPIVVSTVITLLHLKAAAR